MRRTMMTTVALGAVFLGSAARADDASRVKLARELVVVTHSVDNMRRIIPTLMTQVRTMLVQQNPTETKTIDTLLQRSMRRLDQQLDSFADLSAQVYAREFSEDDLQALLAFDRSPAGQHLIDKQPEINGAMMEVGQRVGQSIAEQVVEEFKKEKAAPVPPKL
jgi:hypothetical protein